MKIRNRLTLQFIAISVVIIAIAIIFIFQLFRRHVENEFFAHLENKARMTATMVLQTEESIKNIDIQLNVTKSELPPLGNISMYNDRFKCVFTLNPAAPTVVEAELRKIVDKGSYRFANGKFRAIGVIERAPSGRRYFVVAEQEPDLSKLDKLRNILFLAFFLVIAIVAAGGWFFAGQALLPVSFIVNEVEAILPFDLSRRLNSNENRDELSHLTDTFNQLLDRIERAFQLQRGFISNVSHELKNPVAMMDAQLQLARNKPRTAAEYERVLVSLHEDVQDLSDTIDKLLQLARVHSGGREAIFSDIRLDELVYQSKFNLQKTHPNYTIDIDIIKLPENERELCVRGDEFLLRTALLNLMDNCCKFSTDHRARLIIDFDKPYQLVVEDNGPGIPEQDLPLIFEPFYRGKGGSRQKGSGIGLSLVRSIFELFHLRWRVESAEGRGTKFLIAFPGMPGYVQMPEAGKEALHVSRGNMIARLSKKILKPLVYAVLIIGAVGCSDPKRAFTAEEGYALQIAQDWNGLLLEMVRYANGYKAPVSARMFAYVGVAAWESVVPGQQAAVSLGGRFIGLELPEWEGGGDLCSPAALNAAYARMAVEFFPKLPQFLVQERVKIARAWDQKLQGQFPAVAVSASALFGSKVAEAVFEWAASDSIGHQSDLSNFKYFEVDADCPGKWKPSGRNNKGALLPGWGKVRTFFVPVGDLAARDPLPFSESPHSLFFSQAIEVYTSNSPVAKERAEIARYWSNDAPHVSFCPASRWIAIARQVIGQESPPLMIALETYLKVGIALNDSAVKVWREKYKYSVERPDAFIRRNIDPAWQPLEDNLEFPSYPSGHSIFGASTSVVLGKIYGTTYAITDKSNTGMGLVDFQPRKYPSFEAMAKENALSRIYMGVHYRIDCEEGLRLGRAIGDRVASQEVVIGEKLAFSVSISD
ncbi:MAG: ATP-binding protein [Saprospiraceae bacterium]